MKNIQKYIRAAFSWIVLPFALMMLTSAVPSKTDVSQKEVIRLGIIPLTDCASLVMAKELGLFEKYGVNVEVSKEASWANVRDKILNGELTGAHCLFGMPFSVYTGVGGKEGSVMKIAMIIDRKSVV